MTATNDDSAFKIGTETFRKMGIHYRAVARIFEPAADDDRLNVFSMKLWEASCKIARDYAEEAVNRQRFNVRLETLPSADGVSEKSQ